MRTGQKERQTSVRAYPFKFEPIYKERIWGGRSLEYLFSRSLPPGSKIGESWELADLAEGISVVANGPQAGIPLTELTRRLGAKLLGPAAPLPDGRFPLLVKLLDANDILSLQVHPDREAVKHIDGAAVKTECWYVLESHGGFIYKGVRRGVGPEEFRQAIADNDIEQFLRRIDVAARDFHYLPAGIVHALGPGVVVAEVQTPSDTTYRVTDWGRGREVHVDLAMQCIRFDLSGDECPGAEGARLLVTDYFAVTKRTTMAAAPVALPQGRCVALMMLGGQAEMRHDGNVETCLGLSAGETALIPADLKKPTIRTSGPCAWLEIALPDA